MKPKSVFKDIKYSLKNILVCTGDEHTQIENDIDYYPIVKDRIKFVEDNYELCIEESEAFERAYELNKINEAYGSDR